ncbi:hypothetical protein BGX30_011800 [Mortierella sp. GBA39]|nr:hypothetical protein BGX30_011800 [Mortierella sp. GBA39]
MSSNMMIGIDIGTTSTKAVLFEENGKVVAKGSEGYPLLTPTSSIAEQDPDLIFTAVIHSVKQVMDTSGIRPEQVMFVSFSSAMHSVIPVGQDGKPLMNCITWADNRSAKWSEVLKNDMNGHEIYLRTGTPIHPMSPLTKLMWLRHDNPDIFEKTSKFISIKEYVFAKLFNRYVVDHSIASCTGLMNLNKLDWDEEALQVAGITPSQLSELVPTTYRMDGLDKTFAAEMGLDPSTPFIVGASDGVLSNLGVNAIEPGVVAATIGTSGAIRTVVDHPATDPKGRIFCYALTEKLWVIGGPVNNGGQASRYRFRAPLWNPDARGSFFGLTMHHRKEHMIRAVLEGVIFNLYTVLLAMEERIGRPAKIHATGGFSRSPLWRQMMADIFDQEVVVPESFESSCLGAVVLGLYAMGKVDSLSVVSGMVGSTHQHTPVKENAQIYHQLLPIFIKISRNLEEEYKAIADFQRSLF